VNSYFAICLAVIVSQQPSKEKAINDQERLQGSWKLVYTENNGEGFKPTNDIRVTFNKDTVTEWCAGKLVTRSSFKIDSTKKPKRMESIILENRLIPESKGRKVRTIYQFDGDRLKMCSGAFPTMYPTDFITKDNNGRTVDIYEKVAP
jgi:uncharacterized protein (TIGR03067 family)